MKVSRMTSLDPALPLGAKYLDLVGGVSGRVMEPTLYANPDFCERHLQAIWVNPRLRPDILLSESGQHVHVLHPGRWNLGPGPDFLGARLKVGTAQQVLEGDVEIDIHPSGWHLHGHDCNPDFRQVAVHVTWEPHGSRQVGLPDSVLCIALGDQIKAQKNFSFDHIDLAAYPYQVPASDFYPARAIQSWSMDRKQKLLQAAGQARLILKAERLNALPGSMEHKLYREFCGALGYRNNRNPFQELASRLNWKTLQSLGNTQHEYAAVLLGQSGLLPDPQLCREAETRQWVRQCWDHWWQVQGELDSAPLRPENWTLRSIRPVNHPRRRLTALAALCARAPDFFQRLEQTLKQEPTASLGLCQDILEGLKDPFWDTRLSLNLPPGEAVTALLGADRIRQLYNNGVIPAALALEPDKPQAQAWIQALLPEPHNQVTRECLHVFFGPDAPRKLSQSSLHKLGLLQLFEDWVLKRNPGDEPQIRGRLNTLEGRLFSVQDDRER